MKLIFLIGLLLFSSISYSDTNTTQSSLVIGETDGTNSGRYRSLKFTTGTTTNNGDGSLTVSNTGSGVSSAASLLLENGNYLLLEDGNHLLLE